VGETSVYFVPEDQTRWIGREREVAEAFWAHGVFLAVPDDFVYERIRQWRAEGRALPGWKHAFQFGTMGLGGLGEWEPVPSLVYDLRCPECDADVFEALHEVWEDETVVPLPDRTGACPSCRAVIRAGAARSETPFTFARFFLWVSDIGDGWDPTFKHTVETVLGPCKEYEGWET
jgi:hypothetical protein